LERFKQIELIGKIITPSGKEGNRAFARRYLVYKYGWRCKICGNNVWNNKKIPLLVDHINGNSDDNTLDNLRVICPNCDAQLPTYKGRNRGHGRVERMKRLKLGKSF
jgi:hypothetical protein